MLYLGLCVGHPSPALLRRWFPDRISFTVLHLLGAAAEFCLLCGVGASLEEAALREAPERVKAYRRAEEAKRDRGSSYKAIV